MISIVFKTYLARIIFIFIACSGYADYLYPIQCGGNYGYMNISGVVIVKPAYIYVDEFSDGFGIAKKYNGSYDILNSRGEVGFNLLVDAMKKFREGLAPIKLDGKWGFVNTEGNIIIEPQYFYVAGFFSGVSLVRNQKKDYFFINKENRNIFGKIVFQKASSFYDGYAVIENDKGFGVIDLRGITIIHPQYDYADNRVSDGLWAVGNSGELKTTFIDVETGEKVFQGPYKLTGTFHDGYVAALSIEDGGWGILDSDGNVVVDFQYKHISATSSEGLLAFKNDKLSGYMSVDGNIVIPAQFEIAGYFVAGLARIKKNGRYGYINRKGEIIYDDHILECN